MDRKNIPVVLMLVAGLITCVITFIQKYSVLKKLVVLLIVLILFYFLGTIIKWAFDSFEKHNAQRNAPKEDEAVEEEREVEEE